MKLLIRFTTLSLALLSTAWGAGCDDELRQKAGRAISNLRSCDSTLTNFFEHAAGYAVFPSVRGSGPGLPEEHVRGVVYEKGKPVGEAVLAETNVGQQENATPFHEAIFFGTTEALENFKQCRFVVRADFSAVDAAEGAAATAKYQKGAVIFVVPKNGLMERIAIGEQRFVYKPLD